MRVIARQLGLMPPTCRSLPIWMSAFLNQAERNTNDFWQVGTEEEDVWEGAGLMPEDTDKSLTHSPKYRYPGEATRATLDS